VNQTAICNLALLRLGISQPIADITENSVAGRACNAVWEQCLTTMLRERPWPFAVRQVGLALVGEQLFQDWAFTYRYPTDFINIHRLFPPVTETASPVTVSVTSDRIPYPQTFPYSVGSDTSGRLIHCDVEDAIVTGTYLNEDTAQFDPLFTSALAWFIAAEIALSMTKNRELYGNALNEYMRISSEAAATSLNEVKPRESDEAMMIEARL
jgi:hypothetical protein